MGTASFALMKTVPNSVSAADEVITLMIFANDVDETVERSIVGGEVCVQRR